MPIDGHKADNEKPTTTMKTFSALVLKPQAPEKEKEKKKGREIVKEKDKKDKKKKDSSVKKDTA